MPIHGKQHPDCQRKPINYDRDTTLPAAVGILLFMAGRGGFFFFEAGRGGLFFSEGGRGGCFFFSEAGRGVFFFFFRRDGTKRCFFFSRAGAGRLFFAVAIFLAGRGKIVTLSRQRRFKPSRQPFM